MMVKIPQVACRKKICRFLLVSQRGNARENVLMARYVFDTIERLNEKLHIVACIALFIFYLITILIEKERKSFCTVFFCMSLCRKDLRFNDAGLGKMMKF